MELVKRTIAGAVSTVKAEKLENVPAAGFDQSLQGQTPGLTVISTRGEPSKAAVFQISWYQFYQFGHLSAVYTGWYTYLQC